MWDSSIFKTNIVRPKILRASRDRILADHLFQCHDHNGRVSTRDSMAYSRSFWFQNFIHTTATLLQLKLHCTNKVGTSSNCSFCTICYFIQGAWKKFWAVLLSPETEFEHNTIQIILHHKLIHVLLLFMVSVQIAKPALGNPSCSQSIIVFCHLAWKHASYSHLLV